MSSPHSLSLSLTPPTDSVAFRLLLSINPYDAEYVVKELCKSSSHLMMIARIVAWVLYVLVRMYVCMYVRMYVRMYVCMYVSMYVSTYACTYAWMYG